MAALAQKEPAVKFAKEITAKDLKAKLSIIAGPEMEGRETATEGQRKAAAFIEATFKKIGLKPGTSDGYQVYYPVYQDSVESNSFSVNGISLSADKDFTVSSSSIATGSWTADEISFASFGQSDTAVNNYDGLDVKGKWLLLIEGTAADIDKKTVTGFNREAFRKIANAKGKGIKGLIIISKDYPKQTPSSLKGNMYLNKTTGIAVPVINVSLQTASLILGKELHSFSDLKQVPRGIYPAKLKLDAVKSTLTLQSSNVLGVLPGTDKKDEYVFITGHYDHLGKKDSVIYYGADDDGSGTTSVLELATVFAKAKAKGHGPRRTIVFMTVSGEEKGLWGSEYYSEHPVFPLDKTSVDLNIDMDGRVDTERKLDDTINYIYVIGHNKLSSDLAKINEAANNKYTNLTLDYKYDDPKDPNRIYYRSDHYNFAKKGVPILFFYDGMLQADYHKPTDTVDKINFPLMEKRVKLVFYTAWDIANRDGMLVRDIPLK